MPKPRLNSAHFHDLAVEYRRLARTSPTEQDKMELLNLAERLTACPVGSLDGSAEKGAARAALAPPDFKFVSDPIA
jgi:hypothetical protein